MPIVQIEHVGRRLRVPWWAVGIVGLWLALVGLWELARPEAADGIKLCRVKAWTGVPCPTCGLTRATLAAGQGHLLEALLYNPFMVTAAALAVAWLSFRLTTGRTIQLQLSRRNRIVAWCIIGSAFVANWTYLIAAGI